MASEMDLDRPNIEEYLADSAIDSNKTLQLSDLLNVAPALSEAAGAIVDDSFTRCFKSNPPEPWNWNVYLFPLWCLGVMYSSRNRMGDIPHVVYACTLSLEGTEQNKAAIGGVVKYHGPRPSIRPRQVYVANHTSMIDFIVLEQMTAFAVMMQKHPGWVEEKDRQIVAKKMKDHIENTESNPLLIFPEGTCVNNDYTVMFKKGAFELGCTVCPVAIKYNKIFVDAFWNSKKQSFTMHLLRLMTSWAVVCDVWYLEPQTLKPGETSIEFAERVRDMISVRAGLKKVPWDGYLKYYRPSPKLTEMKQKLFAESVLRRLEEK
ncbi:Glycerol-3-phosphate acyltransferase 3 [Nymphaea thermarum]|nr:Glycerol-3-phosphate acyltransferase 3 [Nymphaea thermarum]